MVSARMMLANEQPERAPHPVRGFRQRGCGQIGEGHCNMRGMRELGRRNRPRLERGHLGIGLEISNSPSNPATRALDQSDTSVTKTYTPVRAIEAINGIRPYPMRE